MSNQRFTLTAKPREPVQAGAIVRLEARDEGLPPGELDRIYQITWYVVGPFSHDREVIKGSSHFDLNTAGRTPGAYTVHAVLTPRGETPGGEAATADRPPSQVADPGPRPGGSMPVAVQTGTPQFDELTNVPADDPNRTNPWTVVVQAAGAVSSEGVLPVSLQRTQAVSTPDQVLWTLIRNRTNAISFQRYREFIDGVMYRGRDVRNPVRSGTNVLNFTGTQAYEVLKQATDTFLMQECGIIDVNNDNACISPVGFLDPGLMETELADPAFAGEFLDQEPRRYGRPGSPVTLDQLKALRAQYYEDLASENNVLLPYLKIISDRLSELPLKNPTDVNGNGYGILRSKLTGPLALELFWCYWLEQGMLVQTLNAILARFQNRRPGHGMDPLAHFDLDPIRSLSNLLWGWAEHEWHRLTVRRRAFEYDHEYGLTLLGRAVPDRCSADSRSNFIQSFHTLLNLCYRFFEGDDDTTVIADGFPVGNALRETHLILAEGAHNQFGDLPSAARAEMLIMQWLLARPEMREFLGGRVMVPYAEAWMDRVDSMKQIQGWTDVSITHFRDMGVFGEQLVLSIRYGNWSVVNDPQQAANWARYWRPEIQRYTHAYRAATGVDLNERADATPPAHLLNRRHRARHQIPR